MRNTAAEHRPRRVSVVRVRDLLEEFVQPKSIQ